MNIQISRRNVLLGSGALIVSFSLAGSMADAQVQGGTKPLTLTEVDSFLAIDGNGKVTVYSGKVDLGTGISTALRQIVAEELDVPIEHIELIQGDTLITPNQGTTWASVSVQVGGMQLRQASAAARQMLLSEAERRLGTGQLTVTEGVISGGGKKVSYGELVGGKNFAIKLDPKQPVKEKAPKDYKVVGRATPRVDIPAKMTGHFTYMQDFKVPGMLHGRVVRPAAIGAKLESVDDSALKNIPGIVKVVREGDFLGVVASNEWDAIRGAAAIRATWSKSETLPDQAKLWDHVRATKVAKEEVTSNIGNTSEAMGKDGAKVVKATYDFAIHTHGSIGPSCAIAEFKDGALTSWSASQATHNLRRQLALMFSLPVDKVRCIYVEGSGCYGRNGHEDAAADAALLAKAVGKPVRVQWSRADEHGWDPKGPPTLMDMRASLDAGGNVTAWEGDFYMPQQTPGGFLVPLVAATLSGMPAGNDIAPGNVFQNSAIQYKFANIKTVCKRLETTPLRPSWIRTPGRLQNSYANECFMDELAAAANMDPLEFRRKYLDDKRGLELLDRLVALAKWEKRPSPQKGVNGNVVKGRGASYVKYELVRTYIGAVAEVEVERSTGVIHVPKFYVVHDCGQIINPDGLKNQIEGNVMQTVSRTLIEELKFDRSRVTSLDWASYPILKFPQMPEIVIELVDRPTEKPWGAGEPTSAVVSSAISNAVFDATGVRLRSVPYTPAKVKAAIQAS
ncbi:MAG TPA: molybdopterin cofactor-binding domain-containing protein [Pseudolabrys sp.]|nr:molybdopterin cofactor-binding domain-containing protein [Pseudolabrys sp.]